MRFLLEFLPFDITTPHPFATIVPGMFLPLNGRFAFVSATAPPFCKVRTLAFLVLATTVWPFLPAAFFFLAVSDRSFLLRL